MKVKITGPLEDGSFEIRSAKGVVCKVFKTYNEAVTFCTNKGWEVIQ